LGQGLTIRLKVFAYGSVEGRLRIVQGLEARLKLVAGPNQGVHRLVQLALAGARCTVTYPQALLEQCAQARIHGLLRFHLAHGGLIRAELHHSVGALKAVAAVLQVGLKAIGLVHQIL
jgi:prophage DNA circulation protein